MRSAIKPEINRTITGAEVMEWFKRGREPWPGEELCAGIAADMNKWLWPVDPRPIYPEQDFADPWWDTVKAAAGVKALLDDVPAMLWNLHRMRSRSGYDAIERLRGALDAALPYIEFPFGKYERQDHRKRKRPKPWHAHAVLITPMIADALRQSGHPVRGATHNSAVVRIACEALVRIGYDRNIIKPAAVAAKLTDWYAEFGRSF
jgi:hypothetical protein